MIATSVGVTARVLRGMGFLSRLESRIILGAAVIDDILGMIVLAVISSIGGSGETPHRIAIQVSIAVLFVLVVIILGEAFVKRLAGHGGEVEGEPLGKRKTVASLMRHETPIFMLAMVVCLGFSALASFLHLAAIIGAFLAGVAFAELREKHALDIKMQPIVNLLTPFFFVVMGLSVDLRGLGDVWLLTALVSVLAIGSKLLGCGLAAKGLGFDRALRIGIGMVPRGEVGIIVALVGLRLHSISTSLYSVVVIMSMITTLAAPPLLKLAFRNEARAGE
jgi:Kef-type K+ transport system membrane component KefB